MKEQQWKKLLNEGKHVVDALYPKVITELDFKSQDAFNNVNKNQETLKKYNEKVKTLETNLKYYEDKLESLQKRGVDSSSREWANWYTKMSDTTDKLQALDKKIEKLNK